MGFGDGNGISWTICKQFAPRSRQISTPAPRHSIFMGWMLFLMPNQQCQSTEGTSLIIKQHLFRSQLLLLCDDIPTVIKQIRMISHDGDISMLQYSLTMMT